MEKPGERNVPPIKHNTGLINLDCKLRAANALNVGDYQRAIYYQTLSLGASKRQKYSEKSRHCSDLGDIIKEISERAPLPRTDEPPSVQNAYTDLCNQCRALPEEWTVLQISKEFAPMATCLTHEEQLKEPTPIWLTIFRYSDAREGHRSEPILLVLDPPADDSACKYPNFFEHISAIPAEIRSAIDNNESTATGESQSDRLEAVEQLISMAVERTRDWLGPWSNVFVGKFRTPADQKLEAEVYNQVEEFCIKHRIKHFGQRLVSLVSRRLDLLQDIHLYELCCCEQLSLDNAQCDALYAFLSDIRKKMFAKMSDRIDSYPVLLVVDELLDSLPWEMIHPTSELCRFSNFWVLSELYRIHRQRIENGYLSINAKNCFTIINPDNNLEKMSVRLQLFYKEWYPDFQLLVDQPPTEDAFSEMLNQSDVVIYNGHGSGFQFVNGDSLLQRDINCVTFLFGCSSIRLYSNGLFTEMTGTHQYYNAAHCPTVIGALWVLTDLFTDIYSMLLVGNWIPSTNPKHINRDISCIDTVALKSGMFQFGKSSSRRPSVKKHSSLLKLMGDCRLYVQLPQRIRCAIVCRGLPVVNKLCN
uniref:separase n=1 Tax=Anopheles atroparvus TaxID=41427 RepID=A0A182JAQ0_ANOAO